MRFLKALTNRSAVLIGVLLLAAGCTEGQKASPLKRDQPGPSATTAPDKTNKVELRTKQAEADKQK